MTIFFFPSLPPSLWWHTSLHAMCLCARSWLEAQRHLGRHHQRSSFTACPCAGVLPLSVLHNIVLFVFANSRAILCYALLPCRCRDTRLWPAAVPAVRCASTSSLLGRPTRRTGRLGTSTSTNARPTHGRRRRPGDDYDTGNDDNDLYDQGMLLRDEMILQY